jgi:hypothetical protein
VKDYYAILGVDHTASHSDIKKAYRKLAIAYHPDKNSSSDAKSRFQEINEAYDVLSDAERRAWYDTRLANPLEDLFSEPRKPHPDPAYRRKRRPAPSSGRQEPPATYVLMRDSLKYLMWISRVGLLITSLFFLDYFLPYEKVERSIVGIHSVRSIRGEVYHVVTTDAGEKVKLYDLHPMAFADGKIVTSVTTIYGSITSVSNTSGTYISWVAYMYTTLIFLPIVLFVISILASVYRTRVEFCFNLNVTAFILVIINLILI